MGRYGDSEHAKRKERREAELHQLNEKLENLESSRKVSEHQVEQLKNALIQLRNETLAVRSELTRTHNSLGEYCDWCSETIFNLITILLQKIRKRHWLSSKNQIQTHVQSMEIGSLNCFKELTERRLGDQSLKGQLV
jgi:chromosome segregation ATPase